MKKIKYIFLLTVLSGTLFSCTDDDPISAGNGDPLNKEVVNVEATLTTEFDVIGEGTDFDFTVTLPNALPSKATITVELELDNGQITSDTVVVKAGETVRTGTITVAADDGYLIGDDPFLGAENAATLRTRAIMLDPLVSGTTYTISSNEVDLGVYRFVPEPNPAGLEILLDWVDPSSNDLDLYLVDSPPSAILDRSESGSRYESITVLSSDYADGTYLIAAASFTTPPAGGTPMKLILTLPTGELETIDLVFPEGDGGLEFFVSFDKSTNLESGIISYTNFTVL